MRSVNPTPKCQSSGLTAGMTLSKKLMLPRCILPRVTFWPSTPTALQCCRYGEGGVHGFGQSSDMKAFAPNAQLFSSVNNWSPYYISKTADDGWFMVNGRRSNHFGNTGLAWPMTIWFSPILRTCRLMLRRLPRQQKPRSRAATISSPVHSDNQGNVILKL